MRRQNGKKEETHHLGEDICNHSKVEDAYSVFVEEVENHVCQSGVAPVSVDQQKFLEIPETWESKVTRHHCLQNTRRTRQSISSILSFCPPLHHLHTDKRPVQLLGKELLEVFGPFHLPASL